MTSNESKVRKKCDRSVGSKYYVPRKRKMQDKDQTMMEIINQSNDSNVVPE